MSNSLPTVTIPMIRQIRRPTTKQCFDRWMPSSHLAVWRWQIGFSKGSQGHSPTPMREVCCINDLKPSNVLIRNDGEPALLDFNLSQSLDRTRSGYAGGTLPYMSPETYRAMMGQEVQPRATSDLYGLGVMLFEFVTGRQPYPTPKSIAPIDIAPAIKSARGASRLESV